VTKKKKTDRLKTRKNKDNRVLPPSMPLLCEQPWPEADEQTIKMNILKMGHVLKWEGKQRGLVRKQCSLVKCSGKRRWHKNWPLHESGQIRVAFSKLQKELTTDAVKLEQMNRKDRK